MPLALNSSKTIQCKFCFIYSFLLSNNQLNSFIYSQVFLRQPNYRYRSSSLCKSTDIKQFVSGFNFCNIYTFKCHENHNDKYGSFSLWNT